MRIIGIDPGVATTGWAIADFDEEERDFSVVDFGVILTSKGIEPEIRLTEIYDDLSELLKKYNPARAGVETLIFHNNAKTAIEVSQARGVVLLALARNGIAVRNFTPLQIKNQIAGYGKADKMQVQENVRRLCNLEDTPKPDDAADAIAIAFCAIGDGTDFI